jgi:hypothetical protein
LEDKKPVITKGDFMKAILTSNLFLSFLSILIQNNTAQASVSCTVECGRYMQKIIYRTANPSTTSEMVEFNRYCNKLGGDSSDPFYCKDKYIRLCIKSVYITKTGFSYLEADEYHAAVEAKKSCENNLPNIDICNGEYSNSADSTYFKNINCH